MSAATENQSLLERFLDDYLFECSEHLSKVNQAIDSLELSIPDTPTNRQVFSEIILHLHSLKGSASLIQAPQEERIARRLEAYVRDFLENGKAPTIPGGKSFERGVQLLSEIITARQEKKSIPDVAAVEEELKVLKLA